MDYLQGTFFVTSFWLTQFFYRTDKTLYKTRKGELEDLESKMMDLGYSDVIGFAVVYPFQYTEDDVQMLNLEDVGLLSESKDNENLVKLLTEEDLNLLQNLNKK